MSEKSLVNSGVLQALSSNIQAMVFDKNLYIRTLTILVLGPSSLFFALLNKYGCALVVLFYFFFGMLEWSGVKRHIKVALLLNSADGSTKGEKNSCKEYSMPVTPHNLTVVSKTILSSFVVVAACGGVAVLLMFFTLYFLGWTLLTLCSQNRQKTRIFMAKEAMKNVIASSVLDNPKTFCLKEKEFDTRTSFLCEEFRIIAEKQPTELFLNFCLEYFGFVWISGLTYPLLVYDTPVVGKPWLVSSLVGNFAADIVALLVGRALKGKAHLLCPAISPQKSIEAAIAGIIAAALVFAGIFHLTCRGDDVIAQKWRSFTVNFIAGLLLGVMGVVGDLLQSLLKRTARVKDSGKLVLGHGGFLDRIDGLLIVFPAMYCIMQGFTAFR